MSAKTLSLLSCLVLAACNPAAPLPTKAVVSTPTPASATASAAAATPTQTPSPTLTPTPTPPSTDTPTPAPAAESLNAIVAAALLSCRYGPGPEYLYLDAVREGWKLTLIGWTGGSNWVWVKGTKSNCWVNARYLNVDGDFKTLPVVYPEPAGLPHTPYYPPTTVLSATRDGNRVTVAWAAVPISPGDYEDENMFIYIVEVWRCEGGQIVFDPIASNFETVTFVDEPGCAQPSHGRVWVQEKHGFAGPAEIPWP